MSEPWTPGPWRIFPTGIWHDDELIATQVGEANAHLTAAAPEMAALLNDIAEHYAIEAAYSAPARALLARIRAEA